MAYFESKRTPLIFSLVFNVRLFVKTLAGGNLFSKLHGLLIATWNEWSLQLIVRTSEILMKIKQKMF